MVEKIFEEKGSSTSWGSETSDCSDGIMRAQLLCIAWGCYE
jgi:hypothetical protein